MVQQQEEQKLSEFIEQKREKIQTKKIKTILQVSDNIKLEVLRKLLRMEESAFYKKIINWAQQFNFKIEGDIIHVNSKTVSEFIDALDKQFIEWEKTEQEKRDKKV